MWKLVEIMQQLRTVKISPTPACNTNRICSIRPSYSWDLYIPQVNPPFEKKRVLEYVEFIAQYEKNGCHMEWQDTRWYVHFGMVGVSIRPQPWDPLKMNQGKKYY